MFGSRALGRGKGAPWPFSGTGSVGAGEGRALALFGSPPLGVLAPIFFLARFLFSGSLFFSGSPPLVLRRLPHPRSLFLGPPLLLLLPAFFAFTGPFLLGPRFVSRPSFCFVSPTMPRRRRP